MWHSVIWCVAAKVSEESADFFIGTEGSEAEKVVGWVGKRGMKMHRRGRVWPIRNVSGRKIGGVTVGPAEVNLSEQEEMYQIHV
jgi:hypothetical protein